MAFTERHHAFISATFYRILKEKQPAGWQDAFLYASRRYAEQRGGRMAQRAIRDGKPLTIGTYCSYGEWMYTDEAKAENFPQSIHDTVEGDDMIRRYDACPWSSQYLEMGLKDGANLYCRDLDMSIARGFNPQVDYRVTQTMHDNGFCRHVLGGVTKETVEPKKAENVRDFEYHCAHIYKIFSDVLTAIYLSDGVLMAAEALRAFREEYGAEMADALVRYRNMDFDYVDR